jgi:hypothetical protein
MSESDDSRCHTKDSKAICKDDLKIEALASEPLSSWVLEPLDSNIHAGGSSVPATASSESADAKEPGPGSAKVEWTAEQDEALYAAYIEHGMNWKKIADDLKGKTPYLVKKRFYEVMAKGEKRKKSTHTNVSDSEHDDSEEGRAREEMRMEKIKKLYARMKGLQDFICDTKKKLMDFADKSAL